VSLLRIICCVIPSTLTTKILHLNGVRNYIAKCCVVVFFYPAFCVLIFNCVVIRCPLSSIFVSMFCQIPVNKVVCDESRTSEG